MFHLASVRLWPRRGCDSAADASVVSRWGLDLSMGYTTIRGPPIDCRCGHILLEKVVATVPAVCFAGAKDFNKSHMLENIKREIYPPR